MPDLNSNNASSGVVSVFYPSKLGNLEEIQVQIAASVYLIFTAGVSWVQVEYSKHMYVCQSWFEDVSVNQNQSRVGRQAGTVRIGILLLGS